MARRRGSRIGVDLILTRNAVVGEMLRQGKIDPRKTFGSFRVDDHNREVVVACRRFCEEDVWEMDGPGLMLYGPTGTGKTHLLHAVGNLLIREYELPVLVLPTVEIPRRDTDAVLELAELDGVLALDDLGAEKLTERALECLYILVDGRLRERLPLLVTTNYRPGDLRDWLGPDYGERIVGRLREACSFEPLGGPDRRWEV